MNKNLIIWAAGFMDGEGTFTIKRVRYVRDKSKIYYQPYICCAQTVKGEKAIYRLKEIFGGYITSWKPKGNRIDTISWAIASRDAEKCIKLLLPYLILKHEQAKIILEFYKCMKLKVKNYRLQSKDYDDREKLWLQMRKLNVKGKLRFTAETTERENSHLGDATV